MTFREQNSSLVASSSYGKFKILKDEWNNEERHTLVLKDLDTTNNAKHNAGHVPFIEPKSSPTRLEIRACFITQTWHTVYAQALLETDRASQTAFVAEAERQVLTRYLQLSALRSLNEERVDLVNALDALNQIRNAARRVQ